MSNILNILAVAFLLAFCGSSRADEPTPRVIASIAGRELLLEDISVDSAKVQKQLESSLKRELKADELAQILKRKQTEKLVEWIYQGVLNEGTAEFGISISEQDQREKMAEIYKDDDAVLYKLTEMKKQLPGAWREARQHPDKARQIYDERLKDLMSFDRWQRYLEEDTTIETIRRLEQMAPLKKDDLYRTNDSMKRILTEHALRDCIAKGINVTEGELLSEYRKMGYDNPSEEVKESISSSVIAIKREQAWKKWLKNRMNNASASIYDDELRKRFEVYLQEVK